MAGRHFWASQASSLASAGRGGRAQHVPQLRLLSKNKRRTQRIVVEVESRGGNPLESCTHRPSLAWCKEGQHKHKRPPGDGSRTTPDAGKSSSPHDDHRRGNIVVPTSTPSAAAATAAVCRIKLPQRQDAIPSRPVFVEIGGRKRAGEIN